MASRNTRVIRSARRPRVRKNASEKQAKSRAGLPAGGALALGAGLVIAPMVAEAATFQVTNLNDSGAGSLRQAVIDANGAAGADEITFQAGLTGAIVLTTGQLYVTDSLDIQGPGAAALAVSGGNASRVFYLYNGSALIDVTISGLTVQDGAAGIGAGIVNFDENLTLDGVVIKDCAAGGDGGGLWADGFNMNLTVRDCEISGNTSGDDGGGVYVEDTGGPLLIQRTMITGNDATGSGGGVYFYDPDDDVIIEDSTISGNSAGQRGGGVYLYSHDAGAFTVKGTTVSGNDAAAGGGLFLYAPDHGGSIANSTISGNRATAGDGGGIYLYNLYNFGLEHVTIAGNSASGSGGGLFVADDTLPVGNSVLGDNTAGTDNDVANGTDGGLDLTYSLVESPGAATISDLGGNIFNQDPQLGPLQDNGGPTSTQLPALASPAVNTGSSAFAADQRGQSRPVGAAVDMGAVEVNPGTVQLAAAAASVAENAGPFTILVNRTGGSDGAVSVEFATADATAVQPQDYLPAAGTLNWANGDSTPKSITVTIVDDDAFEPNETFGIGLTNPQGADLGTPPAAEVTILNDDVQKVPTLGDTGKLLLGGAMGAAALLLLRRRKLAAPVLIITLAGAGIAAGGAGAPEQKAKAGGAAANVTLAGGQCTIRNADGSTVVFPASAVEVKDRRNGRGRHATQASRAASGDHAAVVVVRRGPDGAVRKIKIILVDSLAQAQAMSSAALQ